MTKKKNQQVLIQVPTLDALKSQSNQLSMITNQRVVAYQTQLYFVPKYSICLCKWVQNFCKHDSRSWGAGVLMSEDRAHVCVLLQLLFHCRSMKQWDEKHSSNWWICTCEVIVFGILIKIFLSYSLKPSLCLGRIKWGKGSSGNALCSSTIGKNPLCPYQNYQSEPLGGVSITHAYTEERPTPPLRICSLG